MHYIKVCLEGEGEQNVTVRYIMWGNLLKNQNAVQIHFTLCVLLNTNLLTLTASLYNNPGVTCC